MKREKNSYIFAPDIGKQRKRTFLKTIGLIFLLVLLVGFVINFIMTYQVTLEKQKILMLNLPDNLDQYSILHISNLHGRELGEAQKNIKAALGNTRYSCVVMTGDMLGKDRDVQPVLDLLALMPEETPKFMIAGDSDGDVIYEKAHSSLSIYTEWAETLMEHGVIFLDAPYSVTRKKDTVWFIPEELYSLDLDVLEDVYTKQLQQMNERATSLDADEAAKKRVVEYQLERIVRIREAKAAIQPQDIQIVVTHVPLEKEYVYDMISWATKTDVFSMRYASLILAGHFNGGQVRIPFKGAIYVPEIGWFPEDEQIQGLSYLNGIPQYISPGLGNSDVYPFEPFRMFNNPVLTLITLTQN